MRRRTSDPNGWTDEELTYVLGHTGKLKDLVPNDESLTPGLL